MANTNAPFGFIEMGLNKAPSTPSFSLAWFKIAQADTQKAYKGDLLYNLGTGYVRPITGTPGGIAISQIVGIAQEFQYFSVAFGRRINSMYWPGADAGGDVDVGCVPVIGATPLLVRAQSLSTPFTASQKGALFDCSYAAGTAYSGWAKSGMTVANTPGTTATLPLRLEALWSEVMPPNQPGTDNTTNYNIGIFSFNTAGNTGTTLV
jgi:hypothetical protein